MGQFDIIRLGADRIGLAIEFLGKKVETTTDRAAFRYEFTRLGDVGLKPVELFADVSPARDQNCFLVQPIRVETRGSLKQHCNLFGDARPYGFRAAAWGGFC